MIGMRILPDEALCFVQYGLRQFDMKGKEGAIRR